ncbi:hypothetical protein [Thermoleptolyngbya sp. M55_K2018_002]|uniref:hypothetical protein n=1 Tax=Thermoleptolyngbya sp. M55_K2018_002 TaxID=2747808 RepID=UPI0019F18295|nr:hypothetical protein [Thermoleptolyngbya sp. M55_K2018_002]HIK42131.1 hypothetical protein [Thermoleptolyngbya sp. M55_K2018_002]
MNSHWRNAARSRIADTLLEYEAQQACLCEPFNSADALKKISAAYPFGDRKWHPYKQWLKEVALARKFLKTNRPAIEFQQWATSQAKMRSVKVSPGQLTLIDP